MYSSYILKVFLHSCETDTGELARSCYPKKKDAYLPTMYPMSKITQFLDEDNEAVFGC